MLRQLPLKLVLILCAVVLSGPVCNSSKPSTPPPRDLILIANGFEPFRVYTAGNCLHAWSQSAGLLAALELDRRGFGRGISPAEAEPYIRDLAEQLLGVVYDPDAPENVGVCRRGDPDPPTGVASMAYMLNEFGADWSQETVEAVRRLIHLPNWQFDKDKVFVYNKMLPFPAMHLLFGETACHAPSWERGWAQLRNMYRSQITHGGYEAHDRHYTMFHMAVLGMILEGLEPSPPRTMGAQLFDLKALLSAHLYQPGGHIGVLNTRLGGDPYYFPGTQREMDMGPMLQTLAVSDFQSSPYFYTPRPTVVVANILDDRRSIPSQIHRLFSEKDEEYEFWWLMKSSKSPGRYPGVLGLLGENGKNGFAWQVHVLPGGDAAMGTSYGEWAIAAGNSEGVAVRCPSCEQGFAFATQWQPCAPGDTDDLGATGACLAADADPTLAKSPLYDFERMHVHRSRITLFDPRERPTRAAEAVPLTVARGHQLSQTWLTNWDHPAVGGEKIFPSAGGWYVGRVGDAFVAYRPLGDDITSFQMEGERLAGQPYVDFATFFQLQGRSGGITEIATAAAFPGDTLADFAADLDQRFWSFTADGPNAGPVAEFDYRDSDGEMCRMKLEYMGVGGLPGNERRYIDCSAQLGSAYLLQDDADYFASLHGGTPIASPFVTYDEASDVLRVLEPQGNDLVIDFGSVRSMAETIIPPNGCESAAYLEPAEMQYEINALAGVALPSLDVGLANNGYAASTVQFAFTGDDCARASGAPNTDWLVAPADLALAAAASDLVQVPGSATGCEAGAYTGELTVSAAEANAAPIRLQIALSVGP